MENLTNTTQLIRRYQGGDIAAREELLSRYLPLLKRWARGRLPQYARDLSDTDDLVQVTFMRAINRLDSFESERPGAFLGYLRTILLNLVREELRRRKTSPGAISLRESLPSPGPSAIEEMVGAQTLAAYEKALEGLSETKRLAVLMRVEFDMSYEQIAAELEQPSANATRMMVSRALDAVANELGHVRQ